MIISKNCSQSCLYFQGFWGSKLNGCLLVSLSNLYLEGIQQFSGLKIDIYTNGFKICISWVLVYIYCWCSSYFVFVGKEKFDFSLICISYCWLGKEGSSLQVTLQFAIRGLNQWLLKKLCTVKFIGKYKG